MPSTLISLSASDLLDAFASSDPTPGGGSAAALSGAIGASLLAMVARMPKTKTGDTREREALDRSADALNGLRKTLAELIDEDTRAYDLVTSAYRSPKATDDEKAARKRAIQAAMREATEAPLHTMRACEAVLREAAVVAEHGNPNAASDVFVGTELALAGLRGAEKNVAINLGSLTDAGFRDGAASEAARLLESGEEKAAEVQKALSESD